MKNQDIIEYEKKISELPIEEQKKHLLHLKEIADGKKLGPLTGHPNLDQPWLSLYSTDEIVNDYEKRTVYSFLKDRNKDNMNNTLLQFYNKKISTKKVYEMSDLIAEKLVNDYHIKKGDKVSLCLPTIPETYYLALALWKIGAIANLIDPRINEERIKESIGEDSKLVFGIDTYNEKIESATRNMKCDVVSVSAAESLDLIMKTVYKIKAKIKKVDRLILGNNF